MAAITWRNVTGASAGNPASALAGATSAFSSASRGALDLVDSIRKGTAIKNEELTNQAISDILSSGKPLDGSTLGNFAPGVNVQDVLSSVQGYQVNKSNLDTAGVTRRMNEARAIGLEHEFSPENIQRQDELAQANLDNVQSQLRIRQLEHNRLLTNDAEGQRINTGKLAIERGTYDESPEGLRGQAIESVSKGWEDAVREYGSSDRFKNLSPGDRLDAIDAWAPQARERFIQQEMSRLAPEWFSKQQSKHGLTRDQAADTTLGFRFQNVEAQNTAAITQEAAAERSAAKKARGDASKALEDGNLTSLLPSGDGYTFLKTAQERRRNTLTEAATPNFIENELNIQIDPDDTSKAIKVLQEVGGNKAKFAEIMNLALTGRDRGIIPFDDDNVDWALANSLGARYKADMRGELLKQSKDPEATNPSQLTFQEILNQRRTRDKRREVSEESPVPSPGQSAEEIIAAAAKRAQAKRTATASAAFQRR